MSRELTWLPADPWDGRCETGFRLRKDLAVGLAKAFEEIRSRGGIITSSGGVRYPDAPVNVARSPMSLHYLGRAIDLCMHSGMQGLEDPYVILEDGMDGDRPLWRVMCAVPNDSNSTRSELATALQIGSLDARLWKRDAGSVGRSRTGRFFDLTVLFAANSWQRIAARPTWKSTYSAVEWWHFECHVGLEPGMSTFGEDLLQLHPLQDIEATPLVAYLDYVWDGCRFAPSA